MSRTIRLIVWTVKPFAKKLSRSFSAPDHGFEPRFTASEAAVLPLDETGSYELASTAREDRTRDTNLRGWRFPTKLVRYEMRTPSEARTHFAGLKGLRVTHTPWELAGRLTPSTACH